MGEDGKHGRDRDRQEVQFYRLIIAWLYGALAAFGFSVLLIIFVLMILLDAVAVTYTW